MSASAAVVPASTIGARVRQTAGVAWPLLVGSLGTLGLTLTDTAVLGQTSTEALAAMAAASTVFFLAASLVIPLGTATQILVAQWDGAGREGEVYLIVRRGIVVVAASAAALALTVVLISGPLLEWITGGSPPQDAVATLRILGPAVLVTAVTAHIRGAINGTGRTKITMQVALLTNAVNIVLDVIFVLGFDMGARGVASGTLIATLCGLMLVTMRARRYRLVQEPPAQDDGDAVQTPPSGVVQQWWRIAWPDSAFAFGSYGADLAILAVVAPLGAAALSGFRILGTTTSVLFFVGFACSAAISILVGQRWGAGDHPGARAFLQSGTIVTAIGIGIIALPVMVAPGLWVSLFTSDPAVLDIGVDALRVYLMIAPMMVFGLALAGLVRGSGDTRSMMYVGIGGQILCALPVAYVLVVHADLGLLGAAIGLAAGWVARTSLTWIFARKLLRRGVPELANPGRHAESDG